MVCNLLNLSHDRYPPFYGTLQKQMKSLKQQLYENCNTHVEERINFLSSAITEIQQSANEETKSSAGDKYETARAMAQLEVGRLQVQLVEVMKMKEALSRIPVDDHALVIKPGSLIFTSRGNFYLAINAGKLIVNDHIFFSISLASPIAQKLAGLRVRESFSFNNQEFTILEIQ